MNRICVLLLAFGLLSGCALRVGLPRYFAHTCETTYDADLWYLYSTPGDSED